MEPTGAETLHVAKAGFGHQGLDSGKRRVNGHPINAGPTPGATPGPAPVPGGGPRRWPRAAARPGHFICTLPLTVALTCALPASTGRASSARAPMDWARIITGCGWPDAPSDDTATSRTV